jgi:hypothetical protein
MKRTNRGYSTTIVVTMVTIIIAVLLVVNRQYVTDQVSVWQYQPSSQLAGLVTRTTLNDQGKFYLYASQPAIEDASGFNSKCDRKEQGSAVLGCYTGRYIYIYNVTDPKLDGIREVTIAHETLHAVYDRLDANEKKRVNALLQTEYAKIKDDKKFAERVEFYQRTEPGKLDNELHSIIGTEVATISPELETYYKKYFDDRSKVVQLHATYESLFNDLSARSQAIAAQLTALGNTIEARSKIYNADVNQLNTDIEAFNTRANDGGFSSQAQFQAARNTLVMRSDQLDVVSVSINEQVAQYEALRKELEDIAIQTDALNRSLDSTLAPAPSL